jgi:hypothetical protein
MKKEETKPLKNEEKYIDTLLEAIIASKKIFKQLNQMLQPSKSYLTKTDKKELK